MICMPTGQFTKVLNFQFLPYLESFLCALIIEQKVDFMDSLLVWSSQPERQLSGLPWLQDAAIYWNFYHTRWLSEIISWNQTLCGFWGPLERCGHGFIRWTIFSWRRAEGCCGLAAKGEESGVCGHHSQATQSNTADITELNICFSDFATQQSSGKLQEKNLTYKHTQSNKQKAILQHHHT